MRIETEKLEAKMKLFTGEELSSLTMNDLDQLEEQLEYSIKKVRSRKHQLLHQQIENLRRKEHILEEQHAYLCRRKLSEKQHQQEAVAVEHKVGSADDQSMLEHFGQGFFPVVEPPPPSSSSSSRNLLQLYPHLDTFSLQPNRQDLHGSAAALQLM